MGIMSMPPCMHRSQNDSEATDAASAAASVAAGTFSVKATVVSGAIDVTVSTNSLPAEGIVSVSIVGYWFVVLWID